MMTGDGGPRIERDGGTSAGEVQLSVAGCSATPGSILCDDFEGPTNPVYRPSAKGGSTIAIDETRPHRGRKSLHVRAQTPSNANADFSIGSPVFPVPGNSFFFRAFVYYASPPGPDNIYLFRFSGGIPGTNLSAYAQYGVEGYPYGRPKDPTFRVLSTLIYFSDIQSANHKAYRNPAAPKVVFDKWVCWELQVDGVKGEWRSWLDGVEHFTRTWDKNPASAWRVPNVTRMNIGIIHPHAEASPMEVWFDDFVVGKQRVGCGS